MAITATLSTKYAEMKLVHVFGTLTVGAGNYAAGGIAADLQSLMSSSGILTTKQPLYVRIQGITGYVYEYDLTNKKVIMRRATNSVAPLVELTDAAAIPAGLVADTIRFYAIFPKA